MTYIGQFFQKAKKAPTSADISKALELPEQLTEEILELFDHCNLVEATAGENEFGRYLPARALDKISAYDILMSLREGKGHGLETTADEDRNRVKHELDRIRNAEMDVAKNIKLPHLIGSNSQHRRHRPSRRKPVTEIADNNS
jgi:DNA-binding IscR family transcriptional regulator